MNGKRLYLDSSSLVKRYVEERGSDAADAIYERAEQGKVEVQFSLWNVGEVLGAIDQYRVRGLLTESEFNTAVSSFIGETLKLVRLGSVRITPFTATILIESYRLVLSYNVYQADALQIATCKDSKGYYLVSGDRRLVGIASKEGILAYNIEDEPQAIKAVL